VKRFAEMRRYTPHRRDFNFMQISIACPEFTHKRLSLVSLSRTSAAGDLISRLKEIEIGEERATVVRYRQITGE